MVQGWGFLKPTVTHFLRFHSVGVLSTEERCAFTNPRTLQPIQTHSSSSPSDSKSNNLCPWLSKL